MAILHGVYLLLAILIGKSIAQDTSFDVCTWTQLRAATVRDSVYVNGGDLSTTVEIPGFPALDGSIYAFNFSQSFETNNNSFPAFFTRLPAQPQMAHYWDGTIFATDEKVYLYGYDYVSLTLRNYISHSLQRSNSNPRPWSCYSPRPRCRLSIVLDRFRTDAQRNPQCIQLYH